MLEKIKKIFEKNSDNGSKKQIENLIVLIIILAMTVFFINKIWNDKEKNKIESVDETKQFADNVEFSSSNMEKDNLQEKLEDVLSSMSGIEDIKVLINYSETSQVVAMYNENKTDSSTSETDSGGGIRTITQTDVKKEVVFSGDSGSTSPVTEKIIMPKIEGAIIMIKGKNDAVTKNEIISAVAAVTGLASHKIQVLSMN